MTQVADMLNYEYHIGTICYYDTRGGRCDPDHSGYCDCSGIQTAAMHHVGLWTPASCMNSFYMAEWCHEAGTGMSLSEARVTAGAWVFVGNNEGRSPRNGDGHIAISTGDGRVFAARGRYIRPEIGFSPFYVDPWSYAAWPPGLKDRGVPLGQPTRPPTSPGEAKAMGLTAAKIVPGSHPQTSAYAKKIGWANRYPFVGAQQNPDGTWCLIGFNGAIILDAGAKSAFGESIWNIGHLNQPIEDVDYIDGHLVFLAGDGGNFIPHIKVQYV